MTWIEMGHRPQKKPPVDRWSWGNPKTARWMVNFMANGKCQQKWITEATPVTLETSTCQSQEKQSSARRTATQPIAQLGPLGRSDCGPVKERNKSWWYGKGTKLQVFSNLSESQKCSNMSKSLRVFPSLSCVKPKKQTWQHTSMVRISR